MAICFEAMVRVDANGEVRWSFVTGSGAENCGFPRVHRSGSVGSGGSDDGSGLRQADLLAALESVAAVMSRASRSLTASYELLPTYRLQLLDLSEDVDS